MPPSSLPCKWNGCQQSFPSRKTLIEHVNSHIDSLRPMTLAPIQEGSRLEKSSSASTSASARNLPLITSSNDDEEDWGHGSGSGTEGEVEDVLCEVCGTGAEYEQNLIVLCDGCDLGFHQLCHPLIIPDSILKNEDSLWYCYNCEPAKPSRLKSS